MKYCELDYTGRLFCIGDIHGCFAEINVLLGYLIQEENLSNEDQVVFVGDYIDRGSESFKVIELLIDFKSQFPKTVFLRGNHEDMFLDYIGQQGNLGEAFLFNGGIDTLKSYDIDLELHGNALAKALPTDHFTFFTELTDLAYDENHIIVHAGVDPLRDIEDQTSEDLFWIREDFIDNSHTFGKIVVFGHTPQENVLFDLPYKIGIDTGCCFGNKITCCNLTDKFLYQVEYCKQNVKKNKYLDEE